MSSVLRRPALRVEALHDRDRCELAAFAAADPIVNLVVSARLCQTLSVEPRTFGATVLGVRDAGGQLAAAAFDGGNLLPIGGGPQEWRVLARHLAARRRACTAIVGRADAVATMWATLAPQWGPARAVRDAQLLMALDRGRCECRGDLRVRRIRPGELERYLPAAAAMFTEELGISPFTSMPAGEYRRRVGATIGAGRAFGIVDADGAVIFKADVGAVSAQACQVQGVWVRPELRGRGIGTGALAAVLRHALTLAPTVSLYVNDFNIAARRMYERLGMRQVATLSTVLF